MEVLNDVLREPRRGESGGDLLDDSRCLRRGLQDDRITSKNSRNQAIDKGEIGVLEIELVSIKMDEKDQPLAFMDSTHVPGKHDKHHTHRRALDIAPETLFFFSVHDTFLAEHRGTDAGQVPPPLDGRQNLDPSIRDRATHLLRELSSKVILVCL